VVENYSDGEHVFGRSVVYVSMDSGQVFAPIGWDVAWLSRLKKLSRDWPPHDLRIESLDAEGLQVTYIEASYDGPVDRQARYSFRAEEMESLDRGAILPVTQDGPPKFDAGERLRSARP